MSHYQNLTSQQNSMHSKEQYQTAMCLVYNQPDIDFLTKNWNDAV